MKVIEVPVYNNDGSVKVTVLVSPEEAKTLLQFSLNFLAASGLAAAATTVVDDVIMEQPHQVQ